MNKLFKKGGDDEMRDETLQKYIKGKELYSKGETLTNIAKELKLNRGNFTKWLKENYEVKTKYTKEENYIKGKEMYLNQNKSLTEISKELKISRVRFSKWLKNEGVEIKNLSRVHYFNENYFEKINNEHKAYWLGFIYADGNIALRKRNQKVKSKVLDISLKEEDKKHLCKFKNDIKGDDLEIKRRENIYLIS